MAELNTGGDSGGGKKKVRSKKMNPAVDLTAMVDLAFLLITFFMLTTTLSKPQSMQMTMPDKTDVDTEFQQEAPESRTMTILLGKDRLLKYYIGKTDAPLEGPTVEKYGKDGIRNVILQKKSNLKAKGKVGKEGLIVLIKATEEANYRDLVDILDEMSITGVEVYSLQDITDAEIEMMQ